MTVYNVEDKSGLILPSAARVEIEDGYKDRFRFRAVETDVRFYHPGGDQVIVPQGTEVTMKWNEELKRWEVES